MRLAVVIPAYRVKQHVLEVIARIGPEVERIYVVDDKCPEESGGYVEAHCCDPRVEILYNKVNCGVGGATMRGYAHALEDGYDIVVKIDGDGQMNPDFVPILVAPIIKGVADYTKGNRFFALNYLELMPRMRLLGNSTLSFVNKLISGYWDTMDPTNGFTAINTKLLPYLPLQNIDTRYFFESDMLFRLGTLRAVVKDVPMPSIYGNEGSSLSILRVAVGFPGKYLNRLAKRIFYNYFLRDFNVGSVEILLGFFLLVFGGIFGVMHWMQSIKATQPATSGTVMLAALPIVLGFQLLLAAVAFDVANVPRQSLVNLLASNSLSMAARPYLGTNNVREGSKR